MTHGSDHILLKIQQMLFGHVTTYPQLYEEGNLVSSPPLAAGPAISIQDLAVPAEVIEDGLTLFLSYPTGPVVCFRYSMIRSTSSCVFLSSIGLLFF